MILLAEYSKNGFRQGKQLYKHKVTGKTIKVEKSRKPQHVKDIAIRSILEGNSFKAVARIIGDVSDKCISKWWDKYVESLVDTDALTLPNNDDVKSIVIDEFWAPVKKSPRKNG